MTSLLFYTDANEIIVATDTHLHYPDGSPPGYVSKALAFPHLRMIVAGTGSGLLYNRWIGLVNHQGTFLDVDAINEHAPHELQTLWGELNAQVEAIQDQTATIYHFGFSDGFGVVHGFAYRSVNNFRSERLQYGLGVKPELASYAGLELQTFPSCAPEIMRAQIKQESEKPSNRVYIGGSVQVVHASGNGFSIYSLGKIGEAE